VIDQEGGQHALNKKLTGQTLAQLRERLSDLDRSQLPGVEQAQELQRERHSQAERQPLAPDIGIAADQLTKPHAPIWDRDAAERLADERLADAALRGAAQAPEEGRQQPELMTGGIIAPAEAPGAISIARTAREPDAAQELTATADAAIDQGAHAGERMLRGLGKILSSFVHWIADSIAPPPPPTKIQAEGLARAAEARQEQQAITAADQQIEAQREAIAEQQRARDIARTQGIATTGDPEEDRFRSIMQRAARDRDYERER
jgi:hypothetical protein